MPNLSGIPIRKYQPLWSYNHYYDNLPIEDIEDQLYVINAQADRTQTSIEQSVGNTGSLAARLNVSLEENGSLKTAKVDEAMHSIESHTDTDDFVRMTNEERIKLTSIDENATNLSVSVQAISSSPTFPDVGTVLRLKPSDTITWRFQNGSVYADTSFAKSLIAVRNYNVQPLLVSGSIYRTTSQDTQYRSGSLRIYINGLRLNLTEAIDGYTYTETSPSEGTFTLNETLSEGDIIRIDFDQPLV